MRESRLLASSGHGRKFTQPRAHLIYQLCPTLLLTASTSTHSQSLSTGTWNKCTRSSSRRTASATAPWWGERCAPSRPSRSSTSARTRCPTYVREAIQKTFWTWGDFWDAFWVIFFAILRAGSYSVSHGMPLASDRFLHEFREPDNCSFALFKNPFETIFGQLSKVY